MCASLQPCRHVSFSALDWPHGKRFEGNVYKCNDCGQIGQFEETEPFQFLELYGVIFQTQHVMNWEQVKNWLHDNPGIKHYFSNAWATDWGTNSIK